MKKHSTAKISLNDHLGCFGDFSMKDPVCRKFCALGLRCAIDREQNDQMEIWEDMFDAEMMSVKIQ